MNTADINLLDPDTYRDGIPHDAFAYLRSHRPIFRHADPQSANGFWAITSHLGVKTVSRNPKTFSSWKRTTVLEELPEDLIQMLQMMLLNTDPPEHSRLRGAVSASFSNTAAARLASKVEKICEKLVDDALEMRTGDFVEMCAARLPMIVIADLLGAPKRDRDQLYRWSNRLSFRADPEFDADGGDQKAALEMLEYAKYLADLKRREPGDDLFTDLVSVGSGAGELSELELGLFFIMLTTAGNETVRSSISNGMLALMHHRGQWEQLCARPSALDTAPDEIIRWVSPTMAFRRTAMTDVELLGETIRAGDKVIVYYAAANYDEVVFAAPMEFDVCRNPNPHLGFGGGGPHYCLGRYLALLEIKTMLRVLSEKVDRLEIEGPVRRLRSNFLHGIATMPVRIVPRLPRRSVIG
ncbi:MULTISPECIES: cytochrome P450 [Amycolatopsis]|uniref:Cytochrome P450 n=1 Tax=Amycolatopsis albidoflavus TaxID=102226 RepID=A0ABW5I8Q1_9PSEU